MIISIDCNVTEFSITPPKKNEINIFSLSEKCMIINLCDEEEKIITQTEISIEDARKLAEIILTFAKKSL